MAQAAPLKAPRNIDTILNFNDNDPSDPPFRYEYEPPLGKPKTNIKMKEHPVTIYDARATSMEKGANLDDHGFQFVPHVSKEKEFLDHSVIENEYYPEIVELVKKTIPDAKKVHIFNHTVRRLGQDAIEKVVDGKTPRGPAKDVHIDQTYEAALGRVHRHLPDDADRLVKSRVRLVNVWRPIQNTVAHNPLAAANWQTVDDKRDFQTTTRYYPEYTGSAVNVRWHEGQRFWYLSDQTPEECMLIKIFDSLEDGKTARATPHSAFYDSTSPPDAPQRQSVEVRCLIFDVE